MSLWCDVCQSRRKRCDLDRDRAGKPCCPRCGTRISTSGHAGRSTQYNN